MNNYYYFQFETYQRKFKQPLRTSHGLWQIRKGIIITLKNTEGKTFQGEIAPIPWFGSETIEEALQFCQTLGDRVDSDTIYQISDRLAACQFAFESALLKIEQPIIFNPETKLNYCYLLPTGKQALQQDYSVVDSSSIPTYKWKIAVDTPQEEIAIFKQLIKKLPHNAKLRLDANGGLTLSQAQQWLDFTENYPLIEFIEQPLPPSQLAEMMALTTQYSTTLALDESVANINQLIDCYQKGWRGVLILKAAIAGFPSRLRQFCQQNSLDLVFSSVFETKIARQTALQLAWELGNRDRAVGFGVRHWFTD